jgi:hypothetical protein
MDREECVRRAAELVPVLRERAPQAEALRCIPQATIDDLCRADLLRALAGVYGEPTFRSS